jgi:hypothetical protein
LASANPTLYRFHPFSQPVSFTGCPELVDLVTGRLAGWQVTPWHREKPGEETAAVIDVAMRGPKYVLTSDRLDEERSLWHRGPYHLRRPGRVDECD